MRFVCPLKSVRAGFNCRFLPLALDFYYQTIRSCFWIFLIFMFLR